MATRLSKRQMTERDRVLAWLNNQPFTTSARSKPTIPVLTPAEVREKYSPLDAQGTGQFFTPDSMAAQFLAAIEATGLVLDGLILEPCAGLGALIAPLNATEELAVSAFELDQTCAAIGQRLVPWAEWTNDTPFDHLAEFEGRFDWVIANPPFGTKWGLYSAEQVCTSGATRSEHMFLELALRALKPGGHAAFIAPQTFLTTGTKKFRQWLQEYGAVIHDEGIPLSGEFALTKINVRLFLIERLNVDVVTGNSVPAASPVPVEEVPAAAIAEPGDTGRFKHPTAIIERFALADALALVKPAIKKGHPDDLAFRITADGIELVMSSPAPGGDVHVACPAKTFLAPTSDLFPLVPAQTLVDLVAVMDSGPITITEADGKLHLQCGASTAHISLRSGSCSTEILHRIATGEGPCITLTGEQLASLASTTPASSDEEARVELKALNLSVKGDQLTAACADGYILALRRMTVPKSEDRRALVDANWLDKVLTASKAAKADLVELHFQKNGLRLYIPSKGISYHFWDIASSFPDFGPTLDKFLAAKGPAVRMDVKRWQNFLHRCKSLFQEGGTNMVLATIGCQLYAQVDAEHIGVTEDMLGEYDGQQSGWTVLGPAIAKSMIEILKGETGEVTFRFGENTLCPPVITTGDLTVIAMPLHVGDKPELVKRQESGAIPLPISFAVPVETEVEAVSA